MLDNRIEMQNPERDVISLVSLRPITDNDMEFLFRLYVSTRAGEKALVGWSDEEWERFMRMQFSHQHSHYMQSYVNPSFDIILADGLPAGRLYLDRRADEYRLIDIALLPEFRRLGIGASLFRAILLESEEHGVPVTLHVERNNPILDYYQRIGFRIEEEKGPYLFMVRKPAGRRIDEEKQRSAQA